MRIKAITIRQPWASLIAEGYKTVELRPTRTRHRGPLAIHAGKTISFYTLFGVGHLYPYNKVYNGNHYLLPTGSIIAICDFYKEIEFSNIALFRRFEDQHCFPWPFDPKYHKYGRLLKNIKKLSNPIPCRGMPGLFEVEI